MFLKKFRFAVEAEFLVCVVQCKSCASNRNLQKFKKKMAVAHNWRAQAAIESIASRWAALAGTGFLFECTVLVHRTISALKSLPNDALAQQVGHVKHALRYVAQAQALVHRRLAEFFERRLFA